MHSLSEQKMPSVKGKTFNRLVPMPPPKEAYLDKSEETKHGGNSELSLKHDSHQ